MRLLSTHHLHWWIRQDADNGGCVGKIASVAGNRRTKVSQGDIIQRPPLSETDKPRWGFIVTADCDIAQDKSGALLSYLDIVTVHEYLEDIWAAEVLRKLRARALDDAAALLTKAALVLDDRFEAISSDDLLVWLSDTPGEEILEALQIPLKKQKTYRDALEIVELIFDLRGACTTALQRLRRVWAVQGATPKTIRGRLEQALDYNQATDFHLIPAIPGADPLGYVVLLRGVSSIRHENIHASALDLQIDGSAEGYFIAGSSTDNLRYAISQKMAYLFSRIGMSEDYESHCQIVTQLAVDELASPDDRTGTGQ